MKFIQRILCLPLGYSEVRYQEKRYGVTRTSFNQGKSHKIYAEEIGGKHFVSFNLYRTLKQDLLKPCEMPKQQVIHFLEHYELP